MKDNTHASEISPLKIGNLSTPIIIFALLSVMMLGVYWALDSREKINKRQIIQAQAIHVLREIEIDLQKRVQSLYRIVKRWEIRGGTPQHEFESDALAYIANDPGYQAIEWVDQNFRIRWVVPMIGNEKARDFDLASDPVRRRVLEDAREQKVPTLSSPVDLIQGGKGLLVYNPIFIENNFEGFVVGVFHVRQWLEALFNKSDVQVTDNDFVSKVSIDGELLFTEQSWEQQDISLDSAAQGQIFGHNLQVDIRPTGKFLQANESLLAELIFLAGLLLSLLISIIVALFQHANRTAKQALEINTILEKEISQRKHTTGLLAKERQRLTYILEGTNVGTWEWNVQTGETVFNQRWAEIVGYTLEELAPVTIDTWAKLVHPDDAVGSGILLEKNFNKELDYYEFEARMRHKDGSWVWILDRGRVVKWDAQGKALLMAGTHQEISERKEIELATQEAKVAAEKLADSKSLFLATMSHEIRTPMNGIIGLSELALNKDLSDEVRDYLLKIARSSQNLRGILNDILDFSKLERGHISLENTPFTLDSVLDNLRHMFFDVAQAKSLELEMVIDADVPRDVIGDELRLRQILANLLSNALKFTDKGRVALRIQITQRVNNTASLHFTVSDTGIGIDQEGISQLFVPFSQVDDSITRRFEGTGLGLAISHDLLKLMGGEFKVNSSVDLGTTFSFTLNFAIANKIRSREVQRQTQQKAGELGKQLSESAGHLKGLKILVVEDNIINQMVVVEQLKLAGIESTLADNGQEALDILKTQRFDAILMDMHMPIMGGVEATQHIRANPAYADLPVIALTAGVTKEERERCMESGMNDFIAKPVDAQTMIARLVHWISSKPV